MKARRRLAAALLLLLLFLGGGALVAVLQDGTATPAGDGPADVGAATDDGDGTSRSRRHVSPSPEGPGGAAAPETTAATTATTAVRTSSGPSPRVRSAAAASPPTSGPIRIRRGEPTSDDETGALRVHVDDGAGSTRDDVHVHVWGGRDGTRGTLHDEVVGPEGVTVAPLDPGWVSLTVRAGSLERSTRVRIEPGLVSDVELTLPRGATVTGEVRHREHGLLASITVEFGIIRRSRNVEGFFHDTIRGTTDGQGVYTLTGIQPGPCTLTFRGGPLGYGLQPRTTLVVPDAEEVRHDVLLGAVSLEGVVRDGATRTPVAHAKVTVQAPNFATTETDARGRYEFIDLVEGPQKVCVSAEGFGIAFVESGAVLADRTTRFDIDVDRAVSLDLRLRDDRGAAVTCEVIVSFSPREGTEGTGVSTNLRPDADGRILYDKVVSGSYSIAVSDRMGAYERATADTELRPGTNTVELVMKRSEKEGVSLLVEGTVTSVATGAPVAGAEIQGGGRVMTDAKGRFELRGWGTRPPFVYVRCDGYANERVEVPAEGRVEVALRTAAELVLRVRGKDGAPFVGRLILGFDPREETGTRAGASVEADEHGTAVFRRVAPGVYDLRVGTEVTGRAELEVEIQPGRNEIDVDLR